MYVYFYLPDTAVVLEALEQMKRGSDTLISSPPAKRVREEISCIVNGYLDDKAINAAQDVIKQIKISNLLRKNLQIQI